MLSHLSDFVKGRTDTKFSECGLIIATCKRNYVVFLKNPFLVPHVIDYPIEF